MITAFSAHGQALDETPESLRQKPWQEITARDIQVNPVELFGDQWMELAAGREGNLNLMTIAWGTLGYLWNKDVVTVYVSTDRYTFEFMQQNDYFTVSHFPVSMRKQLQYLGTVSGRNEDKVKGAGLTCGFTELGNPVFAEADLVIECKKIYAQQFDAALLPPDVSKWYDNHGVGIHYMYIGEVVHVWKK